MGPVIRRLPGPPVNVHRLRATAAGRATLVRQGRWTEDQAELYGEKRREGKRRWANGTSGKASRERQSKTLTGPFLAWDGEGKEIDGRHTYTLLANSLGGFIESPTGLSTRECLLFLLDTARQHQQVNHVIYGGSYDSNMILADLSFYEIRDLVERGHVWIDDRRFRIEYRQRKMLHIVQYDTTAWRPKKIGSIQLWDVIGFFQCRFVEAVRSWLPGRIPDLDFVESMKDARGRFSEVDPEEVRRYCILECQMLRELMTEFRNQARWTGYVPTRWDGAGALGARILSKEGIKSYKRKPDPMVETAATFGYFGGRIEDVRTGNYEGPVFGHDIVSAYPHAMTLLPCLAHGQWKHLSGFRSLDTSTFAIWKVRYESSSMIESRPGSRLFPLPVRYGDRVYFPPKVEGWYWTPEVANLYRYHAGEFTVDEGWIWVPDCKHRPFSFVPELFDKRKRLKQNGHPAEKCLKLGLNSLYGKLAQQTGWRLNKDGSVRVPPFHCLEWAGYITSNTRSLVYRLAMNNPASIVAFETDGVYATEKLTDHEDGSLGSWEVKEFSGITYVQSGVYWLRLPDGSWKAKYRGIDRDTLTREMVLQGWADGAHSISATMNRFHGMHMASVSLEAFTDWRQWLHDPRDIQLVLNGKRRHGECGCDGMGSPGLHSSVAVPVPDGGVSEAYRVGWGMASEWIREREAFDESFPEE